MDLITKAKPSARYSDYTQSIVNDFPEWHVARRQRDSLASRLIDTTYGRVLQKFNEFELDNLFTQRVVSQANTIIQDKAFLLDVGSVKTNPEPIYNLLLNSNFREWSNPIRMPDWWNISSDNLEINNLVNSYALENFMGGYSLALTTRDPGAAVYFDETKIYQEVIIEDTDESKEFSALCFYKRINLILLPASHFFFFMEFTYADDSTQLFQTAMNENEDWTKVRLTAVGLSKISKITIGVKWDTSVGVDLARILVDNFMLHRGGNNLFWNRNILDKPVHIEQEQNGKSVIVSSRNGLSKQFLDEVNGNDIKKQMLPNQAELEFIPPVGSYSVPDPQIVILPEAFGFTNRLTAQALTAGTPEAINFYKWPSWVNGRLVKFEIRNPENILATYIPSFPIINPSEEDVGLVEATSLIKIMTVVKHNNQLWVMARFLTNGGLKHMSGFGGVLFILDAALPKQQNDFDEVDYQNNPMFLPILYTYYFPIDSGTGFGDDEYGGGGWGGETPPIFLDVLKMTFVTSTRIETEMALGFKGLITLKYNYFLDQPSQGNLVLLRDARNDLTDGNIVVC